MTPISQQMGSPPPRTPFPSSALFLYLCYLCYPWLLLLPTPTQAGPVLEQPPNSWVTRSPVKGGPVSPGMGYETSLGYDPLARRVIRWGGHNQGGGGEQNAETWVYDPATARWALKEPNTSPPGVCCAQQNLFDPVHNRFIRFSAFSGNHGWQWFREIYLSNTSAWTYDLGMNAWRDMRPLPAVRTSPLRCASWDSEHQVAIVFGGEGNSEGTVVYDPHTNTWTRMNPKVQPAFRSGGNMAYDAARKLHILFGSQFSNDPHTWAYDLRKNEWRDMKPASQPPTDRNDPVLAYDSNGQVVVAVVRAIDKADKDEIVQGHLETWTYDAGKNTWTRMKPMREPDGKGNRRRVMVAVPDQNVILMEDYINPTERVPDVEREQQIWTYRYAAAQPYLGPLPPVEVKVTTRPDTATLTWKPSTSGDVTAYQVLRGEGGWPWLVDFEPVGRVDKQATTFRDTKRKPGTIYHYRLRAVTKDGREGPTSIAVRTQPPLVEEVVVSMASATEARLLWPAPPDGDVAGYHVERAVVEVYSEDQLVRLKKDTSPLAEPSVGAIKAIGNFSRLTKEPLKVSSFVDTTLDLTKPATIEGDPLYTGRFYKEQIDPKGKPYRYAVYAYRVRAVNALGVEGGASAFALTIPSSPRWLFSREEGEQCQLKWQNNPEKGLKGYRVYRMEGPKVNGPGQPVTRLTADPVTGFRYTDPKAGKDTRRYWVVAVDALGQEGVPSAPTWHYRQFRKYYEPFVGEWHQ